MGSNWKVKKLGDVINLKRGYDLPASKRLEGNVPIMASSGITGYHNEVKIEGPGVITGRSGQLGKVFYIEEDYWALNTTLYVEDFKGNYPKFIYYLIQTLNFEQFNAGSSVPTLNRNHVHQLEVRIPSYNIQKRIADLLYQFEEKMTLNKNLIEKLEVIVQSIFKRWFIDFEFPNEQGLPYRSSGGEMVESELEEIPKGWEVSAFSNIMNISSGKRPKNKVDQSDLENCIPIIGASKIMGYTKDVLYEEPILVIGRVGTHGIVQRLNKQCWASDNTLVLKSPYYNFTYEVLKKIDYVSLNRGSTQPLITQTDIKEQLIVKPEETVINSFENIANKFLSQITLLEEENIYLKELRETLLPKLLSGEIEIPDESVVESS